MAWLVSEGRVLASAEVASLRHERRRGLLGRDDIEGAFVIERCRWVHTVGMRFAIDVAYVAHDGSDARSGVVVETVHMARHRIGRPVNRASFVIEASSGSFDRWGLRIGDRVEVVEA